MVQLAPRFTTFLAFAAAGSTLALPCAAAPVRARDPRGLAGAIDDVLAGLGLKGHHARGAPVPAKSASVGARAGTGEPVGPAIAVALPLFAALAPGTLVRALPFAPTARVLTLPHV
jgi:hypothetical protein